jgi:methionyl-tRNA formyltransferase
VNVAIITGQELRSKHLCAELFAKHNVVAILHPRPARKTSTQRLDQLRREIRNRGLSGTGSFLLGRRAGFLTGWNQEQAVREAESEVFPDTAGRYREIDRSLIHVVDNINSPESTGLLEKLKVDVAVCLGGPIYRRPLIESLPVMLNFHSGISPLYNGASTILFAFANGHPHLCGGTLMTMSPVVDGGEILAHYLPRISEASTPASLFLDTVRAAPQMYSTILNRLASSEPIVGCRQGPPLFYCRSADLSIETTQRVRRHLRDATAKAHIRAEQIAEYWREADAEAARVRCTETINALLGLA